MGSKGTVNEKDERLKMERTVLCNGEPLQYQLHYKKVKNVNIRVSSDGVVQVSASRRVGAAEVDRIVQKKADWIARAKAYYASRSEEPQMPRVYAAGEPVCLLGRRYRLRIEPSDRDRAAIQGEEVVLFLRNPENESQRKKVFEAWYGGLCRDLFEAAAKRVYPLFQAYRIPMPAFRIRRMKTRWGSCSPQKRAVTLNLYLAQAPVPCVEYVIAHELAHLVQPNHSPAFYAVLDAVMPDHRERKQLLREQKINCSGSP